MRKILNSLIIIMSISVLAACSSIGGTDTMYIQKSELSSEEHAILNLVDSEVNPYVLDFAVDDAMKNLQIKTYELEEDVWNLIGGGMIYFEDSSGKIALYFDNIANGLRVDTQGDDETISIERHAKPVFNFEGLSTVTSYLTDKINIQYEQEIPLVIQIHTKKDEISSPSPNHGFDEPQKYMEKGYEKVYAITCMFVQKKPL